MGVSLVPTLVASTAGKIALSSSLGAAAALGGYETKTVVNYALTGHVPSRQEFASGAAMSMAEGAMAGFVGGIASNAAASPNVVVGSPSGNVALVLPLTETQVLTKVLAGVTPAAAANTIFQQTVAPAIVSHLHSQLLTLMGHQALFGRISTHSRWCSHIPLILGLRSIPTSYRNNPRK
jgi:hypothetical protein